MQARLAEIVDIDAVNRQAFDDQNKKIVRYGGPEAIMSGDGRANTPAPVGVAGNETLADPYEP